MRRWFLLLMVLLLPLRGWVGDAMAAEMLAQHAAAVPAVAQVHASAAHDCLEHGASHEVAADAGGGPVDGSCPTCASCQACSAVALAVPRQPELPTRLPAGVTAPAAERFASAEPLPAFKPPIS